MRARRASGRRLPSRARGHRGRMGSLPPRCSWPDPSRRPRPERLTARGRRARLPPERASTARPPVRARSRARRARVPGWPAWRAAPKRPSAGVAGIDDIAFTSVISSPILSAFARPNAVDATRSSTLRACRTVHATPQPYGRRWLDIRPEPPLRPAATLRWGGVRATLGHRACRHVCDPSTATRSGRFRPLGRISAPACVVPVRWSVSGSSPWRRS